MPPFVASPKSKINMVQDALLVGCKGPIYTSGNSPYLQSLKPELTASNLGLILNNAWWCNNHLEKYEFVRLDHHPNY
jgi:hypothetical protein